MLDTDRISKKLVNLEQYAERLEKITPPELKSYAKSDIVKDAVERNLQLLSDTQLDILMQLYKDLELRIAGDEESVLDRLKEKFSKGLIEKVKRRRALRNNLVHAYVDSSYDKEAFEQAHNLEDIAEFKREVNKLMNNSR
jgi:uncharacterized protein YutE (UPF0331/DUF86 family)